MKKTFLLIFISILLISCASTPKKVGLKEQIVTLLQQDINDLNQKGYNAFSEGDYQTAVDNFFEVWKANRQNAVSTFNLAAMYGYLGEAEIAGRLLLQAVTNEIDVDEDRISRHFVNVKDDPIFLDFYAQAKDLDEKRKKERGVISYIEVAKKMKYRVVFPEDFDTEKSYTFLIFLHGFGGHPFNFLRYSDTVIAREIVFVMPEAPYPFENALYNVPNLSWTIFDYNEVNEAKHSWELSGEYIVELAERLNKDFNVNSIFLSGFSQGGNMTLNIGIKNEELFNGLISFGGWLSFDDEFVLERTSNPRPVLIVHGTSDERIYYSAGVKAFEQFNESGYNAEIQSFEGGHTIPREEFERALDWILRNVD